MNRIYLLNTAEQLKQVSENAASEYTRNASAMVAKLNALMQQREDIYKMIGDGNMSMMLDNHSNHARFIGTIIAKFDAEVLVDTILWVFSTYVSHGFNSIYWAAQLNCWMEILKSDLSEKSYNEIIPFYKWMQTNIPNFVSLANVVHDETTAE